MVDHRQSETYRDAEIERPHEQKFQPKSSGAAIQAIPYNVISEEVISQLSNTHENRRARQVYEWELMRMRSLRRAAVRMQT